MAVDAVDAEAKAVVPALAEEEAASRSRPSTRRGIEGNASSINKAWKEQFGTAIKSAGEIHALLGVKRADLGAHGRVSVDTSFGKMGVTAHGTGIQIGRSFKGGSVKHEFLFIASHLQGKGLGTRILKGAVKQYQRLGVKKIGLDAAEKGR